MGEQENGNVILMSGSKILELIQNLDFSELKIKERVFMELYRRYGISSGTEIPMEEICSIAYPDYYLLSPYRRRGRYGNTMELMRRLETRGVAKKLEKPVRYKLLNNGASRNYVKYLLRERFNITIQDNIIF